MTYERMTQFYFKMNLPNLTLIFILFLTFGCGNENNVGEKNETNEVSVFLNDKNIKLSKEKFNEFQSILKNKDSKNCHKSQLEMFFNSLNIEFDKDNFRVKFVDDHTNTISYVKENQQVICEIFIK
jgi:hypothetical protein